MKRVAWSHIEPDCGSVLNFARNVFNWNIINEHSCDICVSRFRKFRSQMLPRFNLLDLINDLVYQTISINVISMEFILFLYLLWSYFMFLLPFSNTSGASSCTKYTLHRLAICARASNYWTALRHSTTSSTRSANRTGYSRTYDLYDAQADASREQRTQILLGTMAACEVICIGPLMVLRWVDYFSSHSLSTVSTFKFAIGVKHCVDISLSLLQTEKIRK